MWLLSLMRGGEEAHLRMRLIHLFLCGFAALMGQMCRDTQLSGASGALSPCHCRYIFVVCPIILHLVPDVTRSEAPSSALNGGEGRG